MRWSNIVHHGALQFDQQLLTQQYLDSQYPLLYFGTSPLTSWHVQPKGDSSVVLRETGARICIVPAAFPIPRPCLVVAQLPRTSRPQASSARSLPTPNGAFQEFGQSAGLFGVRGKPPLSTLPAAARGCCGLGDGTIGTI